MFDTHDRTVRHHHHDDLVPVTSCTSAQGPRVDEHKTDIWVLDWLPLASLLLLGHSIQGVGVHPINCARGLFVYVDPGAGFVSLSCTCRNAYHSLGSTVAQISRPCVSHLKVTLESHTQKSHLKVAPPPLKGPQGLCATAGSTGRHFKVCWLCVGEHRRSQPLDRCAVVDGHRKDVETAYSLNWCLKHTPVCR